jgi:hypothetical protein
MEEALCFTFSVIKYIKLVIIAIIANFMYYVFYVLCSYNNFNSYFYSFYYAKCEGEASYKSQFAEYVLAFLLPDESRIKRPKHVVKKQINERTVFKHYVCLDNKSILIN